MTLEQLVGELTLDEKILLLEGVDSWNLNGVRRLGIPRLFVTDGPHGVRKVRDNSGAFGVADTLPSTAFPTSATLANTWDLDLARRMGEALAAESLARGVDVLLAPGVNIKRNPLCGRNFEYFSEDPLVSGAFGAAFVKALEDQGVATSVKHFAANSNEDFRFVGDSVVDERALREIYLPAFRKVITEAKPSTVMSSYNAVNGTVASENPALLTDILRDDWGFEGIVMTDWGGTHDRVAALNAGCELDMPGQVAHNRAELRRAVEDGRITQDTLDTTVRGVLKLIDRCVQARNSHVDVDERAHAALAAEIAKDGAVLLQNAGVLPLNPNEQELLVIGEMFEKMRFQGAGSSLINPPEVITPQKGFDARGIEYRYERGYNALASERDTSLEDAAMRAVRPGQTVLFFGGLGDLEESEGFDRSSMALSDVQNSLIERIIAAGGRVVLVLFAGAPVEIPFADKLAAVLNMYLPGMHGGEAVAALLFGEASPSGKLTESWPMKASEASSAADFGKGRVSEYYESIYVGYRFYDKAGQTLRYPFGHGLQYTSFEYSELSLERVGREIHASFTLTNTGDRTAAEVVQLYVRNNTDGVFKAEKELRAFTKVSLEPRERREIRLTFELTDLAYWDVAQHRAVLENGEYAVLIGSSSADLRLEAPLVVTEGEAPNSPYSPEVEAAYTLPPRAVPHAFEELSGRKRTNARPSRRLTLETRLGDARGSIVGSIMYSAILGRVRKDYEAALRMPDSLERDTRVKNTHFVVRMMPTSSLRSMTMASGGAMPFHVADGIADIAAFHPIRGLRKLVTGARKDRSA